MVGAREAAFANLTLERLGPGVFPDVTCEFVRAREPPLTALEMTFIRLLSSVDPLMCLEMGRLRVRLVTFRKFAIVDSAFIQVRVVFSIVLDRGTARVSFLCLPWRRVVAVGRDTQHWAQVKD